jgi:DNA processing protein
MDVGLLGLAFSLLPWKEGRKAAIWRQICSDQQPSLSQDERRELDGLSKKMGTLRDEAAGLDARLVLPNETDASHLQEGLPYPVALWVRGSLPPPARCLAVVGSRTPSAAGLKSAFCLCRDLANFNLGIISGLARGIDTAAHLGALDAASAVGGTTWGVLGSGLSRPYPLENVPLMERIVRSGGGVLTCFPPEANPNKWHFPKRNLLMAAWTKGVVVVEARAKSGSLITAKLALDLGREVWVMPGQAGDPHSEGGNELLREGAANFARGASDILEDLESLW